MGLVMEHRWAFVAVFLGFCVASGELILFLGRDFFPNVDAGQFRLHVRGRAGLRIEETARLVDQVEQQIRQELPRQEVNTVLDNIGLPYSSINLSYSNAGTIGTSDAEILVSLNTMFQTSPTFWVNPKNVVEYSLAVMSPQYRIDSLQALMNTPINGAGASSPQVLANLATVTPSTTPAVVTHYNIVPTVDVFASVDGRDLGGVADDAADLLKPFQKQLPRGTQMHVRGQIETMASSYSGLEIGLFMSIVLVYLLIVVNFQSWLDPFIIITALPGALAGILWILFLTHTTLSVPALTGAVMCMGVATSNSILMISFARERMAEGTSAIEAAVAAGYTRMRPVIMTALAMMIGMVPMALGMGEGGEQNAPLGRAVIGGLAVATVATLFFVPVVFSIFHGWRMKRASVR